jgi:hypothetical protein
LVDLVGGGVVRSRARRSDEILVVTGIDNRPSAR